MLSVINKLLMWSIIMLDVGMLSVVAAKNTLAYCTALLSAAVERFFTSRCPFSKLLKFDFFITFL